MGYINFSEQEKQTANSADLLAFLHAEGQDVKRSGREYIWESPSGRVSINGSQWYSHYEQTGGGAILFLRKFFGMTFPEAVCRLLGDSVEARATESPPKREKAPREPLEIPPKHTDMRRVYGYLINERFIDRNVIYAMAHAGLLYEDADRHNAVFVGTDQDGKIRHIHKRSTASGSDFKNNPTGNEAEYSFHWMGKSDRLYVFEAPIDLMAYLSLHPENWQEHSYVALCSTSDRPVLHLLKQYPQLQSVYLCLDHDSGGIEGAYRIAESVRALEGGHTLWRILPNHKDWDEDLKALHGKEAIPASEHKEMARFRRVSSGLFADVRREIERVSGTENAVKYRMDHLLPAIRSDAKQSAASESALLKFYGYREVAKAILVAQVLNAGGVTPEMLEESFSRMYAPHRDHDGVERLDKIILDRMDAIDSRVGARDAFTDSEWTNIRCDLLRLAVDCIRQSAAMSEESEVAMNPYVMVC